MTVCNNRKKAISCPYIQIIPLTKDIKIYYPNSRYFLKCLKDRKPFAFPRLTHGFWLAAQGEPNDTVCMMGIHGMGVPGFIQEIMNSLENVSRLPNMFLSVGLLDYHSDPEKLVTHRAETYISTLRAAIKNKDLTLYDSRMYKSMAISGEIAVLPRICQRMHTVVVGSDVLSILGERWNLSGFTHIEIPLIFASKYRYDILKKIEEILEKVNKPAIVLFRAGSLSYWLTYYLSLKYPDVFYLDLGQVLNIWLLDQELDWWHWGVTYTPTVLKSCRLEGYYQKLLGDKYTSWYKEIQNQNYEVLREKRHMLWFDSQVPKNTTK